MKRQLLAGRDTTVQEIELRNKFLSERLDAYEQEATRRTMVGDSETISAAAHRTLQKKEQKLQKDFIKVSEENVELKLEIEKMNKDVPRLRQRVHDLQQYVDVLKMEKEQLSMNSSGSTERLTAILTPPGGVRRVS